MTAPLIPIRCTMRDGTTHIEHVVGMSVACAHRPDAVALELVDGGPDWRRVGPGLLAAAEAWRVVYEEPSDGNYMRHRAAAKALIAAIAAAKGDEP